MKIGSAEFAQDNLTGTQWVGLVEDTNDPKFEGRAKVRVYGKFDGRVDPTDPESAYLIPTENLPWSRPANGLGGGSSSGGGKLDIPKIGSEIQITFDNGDIYAPTYHYNIYPSDELKAEVQPSYQNAHVLIYDTAFAISDSTSAATNEKEGEGIKVFFTEEKGFVIDYATPDGSTVINVKNDNTFEVTNANGDSIVMSNDGKLTVTATSETHINSPKIKLGEQAAEAIIKGDTFAGIFDAHVHIGNFGAPTSPPTTVTKPALSTKNTTD